MKKRTRTIEVPIYGYRFKVSTSTCGFKGDWDLVAGKVFFPKNKLPTLVLNKEQYRTGTLAHESVHLAWHCLNRAGITVTYKNDEILSYLVGYIFEQVYLLVKEEIEHV